MFEDTKGGRGV